MQTYPDDIDTGLDFALRLKVESSMEKHGLEVRKIELCVLQDIRIRTNLKEDRTLLDGWTEAYLEILDAFPDEADNLILGCDEYRIFTPPHSWEACLKRKGHKDKKIRKRVRADHALIDAVREKHKVRLARWWKFMNDRVWSRQRDYREESRAPE